MNGMEIINKIHAISHGWWRPSPGSIYPLLEALTKEEMIRRRADGRYNVTSRYRQQFGPVGEMEDMLTSMEGSVSYLEDLARSDKKRFAAYKGRLKKLNARLSKL